MTELAPLSDGLVKLEQIVVPLEWKHLPALDVWSAADGAYWAWERNGVGYWRRWWPNEDKTHVAQGAGFHARTAAEADYRARIASALNLDPILSEIKRMREALAFYRDEFHPKVHKPMPGASGITFHPSEALLDDCGQRAMDALSTLSPQEPTR